MGDDTASADQNLQSSQPMMEPATTTVMAWCCLAGGAPVKKDYSHNFSQVHITHTQDASSPRYEVMVHLKARLDVNVLVLH